MTSGAILSRTSSLGLAKLRFNFPNWGDEHNRNLDIVDAALQVVGVAFDGAWANDTAYAVGTKIIDPADATFWRALVAHTSPTTGTFAAARTANPSYWEEIINIINFRGEWADATAYQLNDIVYSGYKWAIVVKTHTSATSFDTGVSAGNLEIFFDATAVVNETESHKTAAETAATNAAASAVSSAADAVNTNADAIATAADRVQTGLDVASTAADVLVTNADAIATAADAVATAADRVQTGLDAAAAAASEDAAADSAAAALVSENNAAATLAGAIRHDIVQALSSAARVQVLNNLALDFDDDNRIINGDFSNWQRGTSHNTDGYGSVDRWRNTFSGGTTTISRSGFGTTSLDGNLPKWRCVVGVTGQSDAGHFSVFEQFIEDVRSYAGQTITVLGYARRGSGSGNMAVGAFQGFGTGGSPSSSVVINAQQIALSSSFEPFAITLSIPSIAGKTIGTSGTDHLRIRFWLSAGSSLDIQSDSLGIQTINVEFTNIHIRRGTWPASAAALYRPRHPAVELMLCQRYYQTRGGILALSPARSSFAAIGVASWGFAVPMRGTPSVSYGAIQHGTHITTTVNSNYGADLFGNATSSSNTMAYTDLVADAEL